MRLLYLLILALVNSCIAFKMSVPSFPSMISYFSIDESIIRLTITTNLIGFCIGAIIYGPLSDVYGRRKVMLIGNGVFVIGSLICVVAPTIQVLLVARFIQGFGAATSVVIASAIISDSYKVEYASKLYGITNAVFVSLMALAAVIGGFIESSIGWRGNYGVVAFVSIVSWLLLCIFLPETAKNSKKIDVSSILLEYLACIKDYKFLSAAIIPSILYGCYMSYILISPFLYMQTMGLGIFAYTLHSVIVIGAFAFSSFVLGKVIAIFGIQRTLYASLIAQFCAATLLFFVKTELALTIGMSVFSSSFAFISPIVFARSLELFPKIKGAASSAIVSLRYLICAVITAVCSYVFDGSILSLAIVLFVSSFIVICFSFFLIKKQSFLQVEEYKSSI